MRMTADSTYPIRASVARLQAGTCVTSVALQHATMLSRAASAAFKVSPIGEEVYQGSSWSTGRSRSRRSRVCACAGEMAAVTLETAETVGLPIHAEVKPARLRARCEFARSDRVDASVERPQR